MGLRSGVHRERDDFREDGAKGGRRRGVGGVGGNERLEAGKDLRTVRIGRAEALDVREGGGSRGHVGGEFGIDRGKIVLDMCMNKMRKKAGDRKVVNCSLLEKGDGVRSEGDKASRVGKGGT